MKTAGNNLCTESTSSLRVRETRCGHTAMSACVSAEERMPRVHSDVGGRIDRGANASVLHDTDEAPTPRHNTKIQVTAVLIILLQTAVWLEPVSTSWRKSAKCFFFFVFLANSVSIRKWQTTLFLRCCSAMRMRPKKNPSYSSLARKRPAYYLVANIFFFR